MRYLTELLHLARSERGTSIIEFSIGMPFLVILLFGTIDLGRAIERHMAVNRVVYEGLRYAATLSSLEEGQTTGDPTEKEKKSVHNQLRERIKVLSVAHGLGDDTNGRVLITLYTPKAADEAYRAQTIGETSRTRIVCISMERGFSPLFSPLRGLTKVAVSACGPYLFPEPS